MAAPDRINELLKQNKVTGIDFIYIHKDPVSLGGGTFQVKLDVNFFKAGASNESILAGLDESKIHIYPASFARESSGIPVAGLEWKNDVLKLTVEYPGDFALYKLQIKHDNVDPYFNDITFNFKANCESDLDCKTPEHECPLDDEVDFPVDYQARDFWSFRRALTDFASQRYPDWQDRLEADAGIMLIEVMSALGDEFAYYQDRIGREAYLETATQRRSLRRHARLVDYSIHNGLGASTWLSVNVKTGECDNIKAGTDVWAVGDDGTNIHYEVGRGLREVTEEYKVDSALNEFKPHIWDEDYLCLPYGATELYVENPNKVQILPPYSSQGKWMLLETNPENPAIEKRRWMIKVIKTEDIEDKLFSKLITRLIWEEEQAIPFEIDLTALKIRGNLVPITAGITESASFVIGMAPEELTKKPNITKEAIKDLTRGIEREGRNGGVTYLFSLPDSDVRQLVWLGEEPRKAKPEIVLEEVEFHGANWEAERCWDWKPSLMGSPSSQSEDPDFIIDDGIWKRVVGYRRIGEEIEHVDYASGSGNTIRFGDGEFGFLPAPGTVFRVKYRLGNGRIGNVSADSITKFDKSLSFIESITNPFPADNGMDMESAEEISKLVPDAFRSVTYRAVRPEDYAEAAKRLSWVQNAGGVFRWTGSWLSAFVTSDPKGSVTLSEANRSELVNQLERFRQAGREAHILNPQYADLDLKITICVEPYAYPGEVKERVMDALLGKAGILGSKGFFSPDNFTFGTSLDRSRLEAAIQSVPGVRAVKSMKIRRKGWFNEQDFTEQAYEVGKNEIVRVENDPQHPERGSLLLVMEGGA